MAVKEAVLFRGTFVKAYDEELKARVAELPGDPSELARLDLSVIDPDEDDDLDDVINDDGIWLSSERDIFIDKIDSWRAPDLNDLVRRLKDTETEWNVVMVQLTGEPVKSVTSILTEDVHDYRIDLSQEGLAEWFEEWLGERGVRLERGVADEMAEFAAEDAAGLVEAAAEIAVSCEGRTIDIDEALSFGGNAGMVPVYHLTRSIAEGDRQGSLDVLDRMLNGGGLHPLQVLSMLKKRYRGYLMMVDQGRMEPSEIVELIGGSPAAARYAMKEARTLGRTRAIKSLSLIAEADAGLKGGQALDEWTLTSILVSRLSNHFHLASKTR